MRYSCADVTNVEHLAKIGEEADRGKADPWSPLLSPLTNVFCRTVRGFSSDGAPEASLMQAEMATDSEWHEAIRAAVAKGVPHCDSPIEKSLFPWLIAQEYEGFKYNPACLLPGEQDQYVPFSVAVIPQLPIGRYRADFALAASRGGQIRLVIVECDGAKFHDGVREVMKDVDRDVRILNHPRVLDMVRLTGREIFIDPRKAAKKAATAFAFAWSKNNRAMDHKFKASK